MIRIKGSAALIESDEPKSATFVHPGSFPGSRPPRGRDVHFARSVLDGAFSRGHFNEAINKGDNFNFFDTISIRELKGL